MFGPGSHVRVEKNWSNPRSRRTRPGRPHMTTFYSGPAFAPGLCSPSLSPGRDGLGRTVPMSLLTARQPPALIFRQRYLRLPTHTFAVRAGNVQGTSPLLLCGRPSSVRQNSTFGCTDILSHVTNGMPTALNGPFCSCVCWLAALFANMGFPVSLVRRSAPRPYTRRVSSLKTNAQ